MLQDGALLIVYIVGEKLPDGFSFERHRNTWPLHITLVPWFSTTDEDGIIAGLGMLCKDYASFSVEVGGVELFGPNQDVEVNVIAKQNEIRTFHITLLDYVINAGAQLENEQHWIREQYNAHITRHDDHGRASGDIESINSIALVKYDLGSNTCRFIKTIELQVSS
jgi:2'-5' RNA ligase